MNIQLMDVRRQFNTYAKEYEKAVLDVLHSGKYIGGEEVENFEQEFAEYEGAKYGIACGNGTDSIVLALRAANIGHGDEVITVPFTFFATAESIAAVGAIPVFVDVDEKTYCMNPVLVEEKITKKTKAILLVHIYGQAGDIDSIVKIAKRYNLVVICDCAQASGTTLHGKRNNILGDISCFSFFPTKNLGAAGDGGMVLTNNETYAMACYAYRAHGSGKNGLDTLIKQLKRDVPPDLPQVNDKYHNYLIGYNSRLDSLQAALLRCKLKHMTEFINGRRRIAHFYNEQFKGTSYITPFETNDSEHSYYIYALRHKNAKRIIEYLRQNGIPAQTYYPVPLHLQGAFINLGYKKGDYPITEVLCNETFAIPVFPELNQEEIEYIVKKCKEALNE